MNENVIITAYVVIVDVLKHAGHESHCLAQMTDAQILTIAVIAAVYFQNHHERALCVMQGMGYVQQRLSISRFNRRLHQLAGWLPAILLIMGEVFGQGTVFIVDSLPVPVCKRVRATRCRKVRGRAYCGYCAAKREKFFGWRLHLVCTTEGVPIAFDLRPASEQDLTPLHELLFVLPSGATVFGDKGYISTLDAANLLEHTGVR